MNTPTSLNMPIIFYQVLVLAGMVNSKHQFTFQALDSRTKTFNELYGPQPNLEESKAPLAFVANWRGSLFDGKFNTIWSYARP